MFSAAIFLLGLSSVYGIHNVHLGNVHKTLNALEEGVKTLRTHLNEAGLVEKKVLAYFNTGDLATIPTDNIDYLLFAFAFVDTDGNIYLDAENQARLDAALPVIQERGLKTLISVGGYGHSDTFPIVAASEEARKQFASSTAAFLQKYQFQGIDIDWEFKNCEEAENYELLVNAMREGNPNKVITVTVFRRPNRMACVDYQQFDAAVDYYNLLTYEYFGAAWSSITGFNTPLNHVSGDLCYLYIDASTDVFLGLRGVSKSKVLLGLAFYGQQFSDTDGLHQPFVKGPDSKRIDYKDIEDISSAEYNAQAQAVFIHDEAKRRFTTFDNVRTIGDKCDYIIEREVAGAFVWELGEDKNSELMNKVLSTLKPPATRAPAGYCQGK